MKRVSILTVIVALLLLAFPQVAVAEDEDQGEGMHFGPYAGASSDSGTCGPDWAQDTFKRVFTVSGDASGTWQLREDFKDGKFLTIAGRSPGACETSTAHGTTVAAGIKGNFKGFESGSVTGGTFNAAGGCPAPCTSAEFLLIHFGVNRDAWNTATFKFTYHAEAEHLAFRKWQNASPDQGGNEGDIATH